MDSSPARFLVLLLPALELCYQGLCSDCQCGLALNLRKGTVAAGMIGREIFMVIRRWKDQLDKMKRFCDFWNMGILRLIIGQECGKITL